MLCQICKKSEATVHYTELSKTKFVELHLCEKCAVDKGISIKPNFLLADLLTGLVELERTPTLKKEQKCSSCGLTYTDFKNTGRLGCAKCYKTFRNSLTALFKKIHASSTHTGKIPVIKGEEVDETKVLKRGKRSLRLSSAELRTVDCSRTRLF